jgi:hypothetical protein
VADDAADTFKLDGEDSFFSIPDYVPTELPDLAAIGSGERPDFACLPSLHIPLLGDTV